VFTGIIQAIGEVDSVSGDGDSADLCLRLPEGFGPLNEGESLAVDGVCLTATQPSAPNLFLATVSWETLDRTTLGSKTTGDCVNLERALRPIDHLGGHFISGHIDGTGHIRSVESRAGNWELSIAAPEDILRFCVEKGSVAIDGISLTIASLDDLGFTCAIIPHTYKQTTLHLRRPNEAVNLEADMLGKYVQRFLAGTHAPRPAVTWQMLKDAGFM